MGDIDRALNRLQKAAEKVDRASTTLDDARRERDDALRAARDVKASYVQMQEASGLSAVTVAKVLRTR
ncbi:hypothetical protein [Amnibacterium kyonggiense]|uniref:Uncharacterized protein n=1 Tax=Amnibacterium kyonggiense TaxID=595671 RepID=A0A4R7FGR1_9MICO|nr:hypothetical protein [Amnibacterium kyonggiense]TDS75915.1 hypothetical protein CLV52_3026 [Amnibacterium kyonggiense]